MLNRLSIKTKLVFIMLTYSLLANLVVGTLGWWNSRETLVDATVQQLNTLRKAKAREIEAYFTGLEDQLWSLSQSGTVIEAAVRLDRAFRQLQTEQIPDNWRSELNTYYTAQFLPKLFETLPGDADYELYRPSGQAAEYLQYHYIVANPEDEESRLLLTQAAEESEYSELHASFHPYFSDVLKRFAFEDIKLVGLTSGDVVYSVAKKVDFGNNLLTGPFARSSLAAAFKTIRDNPDRGTSLYVDFDLYRPDYGHPAAFVAAPIFNGSHPVAVIVLQLSTEAINQIMTSGQNWEDIGLGKSGETFLVGTDQLMRSDSRLLIEDPTGFLAAIQQTGLPERNISLIQRSQSSVLYQNIDTSTVQAALNGQQGYAFVDNYYGVPVISSYQPIQGAGSRWALLAEIREAEALQPFYTLQNRLLVLSVLLEIVFAFSAIWIANWLVRPIDKLVSSARIVDDGDLNAELQPTSQDEIGELTKSLAGIVSDLRGYQNDLEARNHEIERLSLTILPTLFVPSVHKGVAQLTENSQQVTILLATVQGVESLTNDSNQEQFPLFFNELASQLDEHARQYDIEKFFTGTAEPGLHLVALCGFSVPHLDHARRSADFALALLRTIDHLQNLYGSSLQATLVLASGSMTAAMINSSQLAVKLWGEAPQLAYRLKTVAHPGQIVVSQSVYDRLHEFYLFERRTENSWTLQKPA